MALVNCKVCGHKVDRWAKVCPSCGAKNPGQTFKNNLFMGICFIVAGLVFVHIVFSMGNPNYLQDAIAILRKVFS